MLELFKGQLSFDDIKYNMPYKEALLLRDVRVERLKKEREDLDRERQAEAARQQREAARNKIILPK
jgi:hypothetical protein